MTGLFATVLLGVLCGSGEYVRYLAAQAEVERQLEALRRWSGASHSTVRPLYPPYDQTRDQ